MGIRGSIGLGILIALAGISCSNEQSQASKDAVQNQAKQPVVVVTNYPLHYMAQQIGGSDIELHYPVPPDRDPAYWKPDADAISLMQQADLILLNGAGHEPWLETVTLDESKLLDTSKAFEDQLIVVEDALVHSHGPEGKHAHEGVAFTVWFDPQLALRQAQAIEVAFSELLPERKLDLSSRFEILKEQFLELDAKLDALTAGYRQQPLLASHPVYQYLQRRAKLKLESLHWEPDQFPDETAWSEFDALMAQHPAKWMFWEDEPLEKTRSELEKRGIRVLVIVPCGNTPDNMDFLKIMSSNLEQLLQINTPKV